ncbi:MAG: hypothetical protein A3F13_02635 [Gammaproteobacteria bacterium RIFCSPHIGHO2_12_FULL_40_19]|nr:MAG: hypothetical protein A3F13_02635 [Gammaproteobacteria bacterium RIFCSPHIGHO2_12_FULL_40_19]
MKQRRLIPRELFEKIIDGVALRDRVVAKLLYFGAPINQNDVYSLKIDQIDFDYNHINFDLGSIRYDRHVFLDLDLLIGKRKKGFVFTGRREKKIDPTVPYRALKKSAKNIEGLGDKFSLKDLSNRL